MVLARSACAHLSPIGNIAACVADLWSNESIQNIKLLGGMAPTVSMEQLIYDCRLMNEATKRGDDTRVLMRDLLADSDSRYDPQAYTMFFHSQLKSATSIVLSKSQFVDDVASIVNELKEINPHVHITTSDWREIEDATMLLGGGISYNTEDNSDYYDLYHKKGHGFESFGMMK